MGEYYNQTLNSLSIAGSGSASGGEYGSVMISGSGKVTSDIKCLNFKAAGSAHVMGNIACSEEFKCSGSAHVDGNITCKEMHISGSCHINGVEAEGSVHISGSCNADGNVKGGEVKVSGTAKCGGSLTGETVTVRGSATVKELISGEVVDIEFYDLTAGSVGGSKITIVPNPDKGGKWLKKLGMSISSSCKTASIGEIEGDEIALEFVKADVVRGSKVQIGAGCDIKRVEYTESLTVDPDAKVGESVKI